MKKILFSLFVAFFLLTTWTVYSEAICKMQAYSNVNLQGTPLELAVDKVDFDWGAGNPFGVSQPPGGFPTDNFSVRFVGKLRIDTTATYFFQARSDDGQRLWISPSSGEDSDPEDEGSEDETLVIDDWIRHSCANKDSVQGIRLRAGTFVNFRYEVFEATGLACARLSWRTGSSNTFVVIPASNYVFNGNVAPITNEDTGGNYLAEYFNNMDLSGVPVKTVQIKDSKINYDWQGNSPSEFVNPEGFSIRFQGWLNLPSTVTAGSTLKLQLVSDDGGRLFVEDTPVIDYWTLHTCSASNGDYVVPNPLPNPARVWIRFEMFENTGLACAKLLWKLNEVTGYVPIPGNSFSFDGTIPARFLPPPEAPNSNQVQAEFFPNKVLGPTSGITTIVPKVDFDWGSAAPIGGIPADEFSCRFSGFIQAPKTGNYRFRTFSDDGQRFYFNNDPTPLINDWTDHSCRSVDAPRDVSLVSGQLYPFRYEMYENRGLACAKIHWRIPGSTVFEPIPSRYYSFTPPAGIKFDPFTQVFSDSGRFIVRVSLYTQPTQAVTVTLTSDFFALSSCSILFGGANGQAWNSPVEIELRAISILETGTFTVNAIATSADVAYSGVTATASVTATSSTSAFCTSWGDPHFQTFDGLKFDSFADGDYYLVRSLDSELVIQSRQGACASVTCNFGMFIKYKDQVISLFVDKATGASSLQQSSNDPNSGLLVVQRESGKVVTVILPDGSQAENRIEYWSGGNTHYISSTITLSGYYKNFVQGLCGNWDGVASNDLLTGDVARGARSTSAANLVASGEHLSKWPNTQIPIIRARPVVQPITGVTAGCPPSPQPPTPVIGEILKDLDTINDLPEPPPFVDRTFDVRECTNTQINQFTTTCNQIINSYSACNNFGTQVSTYLDSCVFDMCQTQDTTTFIETMKRIIEKDCEVNVKQTLVVDTPPPPAAQTVLDIVENCPLGCVNGRCRGSAGCECDSGWSGEACDQEQFEEVIYDCDPKDATSTNGLRILFLGRNFLPAPTATYYCTFNGQRVDATYITEFEIACQVPLDTPPGPLNALVFVKRSGPDRQINIASECKTVTKLVCAAGTLSESCETWSTPEIVEEPVDDNGCLINPLGPASQYNVFMSSSFVASKSDIEGSLAAKKVELADFTIGLKLDNACDEAVLLTKSSASFVRGTINNGKASVGPGSSFSSVGYRECSYPQNSFTNYDASTDLSFSDGRRALLEISAAFATSLTSGTVTADPNFPQKLTFTGTLKPVNTIEFFHINGIQLLNARSINFVGLGDSVVVINVAGRSTAGNYVGLSDVSLDSLFAIRNRVIWNFYEARTVVFFGVAVFGHVLAPLASFINPEGVIWGNVYGMSWRAKSVSAQVNISPQINNANLCIPKDLVVQALNNFVCPPCDGGVAPIDAVSCECPCNIDPVSGCPAKQILDEASCSCVCSEICPAGTRRASDSCECVSTTPAFRADYCISNPFGVAGEFNAVFNGPFSDSDTRIGGRLAAFTVDARSIAIAADQFINDDTCTNLPATISRVSLYAQASLSLRDASVSGGDIVAPAGSVVQFTSIGTGCNQVPASATTAPFDLQTTFTDLANLAKRIENIPINYGSTATLKPGNQLELFGTNNELFETFHVSASDLSVTQQIVTVQVEKSATIIINVRGSPVTIANLGFEAFVDAENRIFWNFLDAFSLTINQVGFVGTILAPFATITAGSASINGQIFAAGWGESTSSIKYLPFMGCLPVNAVNDGTVLTSTGVANRWAEWQWSNNPGKFTFSADGSLPATITFAADGGGVGLGRSDTGIPKDSAFTHLFLSVKLSATNVVATFDNLQVFWDTKGNTSPFSQFFNVQGLTTTTWSNVCLPLSAMNTPQFMGSNLNPPLDTESGALSFKNIPRSNSGSSPEVTLEFQVIRLVNQPTADICTVVANPPFP